MEAGFKRDLNLPTTGSKYIKLKSKGDKLKFLIAGTPHYETKHWVSDREAILCDKYNSPDKKADCDYCSQYAQLIKDAGSDKGLIEEANKLRPQVTFYYPVLDLTNNVAGVFQTSPSVHWTIVGYSEDDVDVFKCAWSVTRTEEPGKYYETRRLDPVKLTPEQEEVLATAKTLNLERGKQSESVVADKEEASTENPKSGDDFIAGLEADKKE
jgi:hypothetical protein